VTRRAIFLDRDGTLNELVSDPTTGNPESPLRVEDVTLIRGAAAALDRLAQASWTLIGVSNQPAAAKGAVTADRLWDINERVRNLVIDAGGPHFDDFRLCLHHPNGTVAGLATVCECRKPKPGLLLQAAASRDIDLASSWMIGDTDADVLAGQAAGCRTLLLRHPDSAHKRVQPLQPTGVADTLLEAVAWLLATERQG
jgi:D-glycero-D-manno-heptose 1,7-bisphosphate phosphatase